MLFYRVFVLLLSANFFQQYEQIRNPNLFIVSTHNYSPDFTLNKLSVSAYEVTFANDLYIDIFTTFFYHLKHNRIVPLSIPVEFKQRHHRLLLILILSGDISVNPGPPKHPCGYCYKPVAKNHRAVLCEACNYWSHIKCARVSPTEYISLSNSDEPWLCGECNSFKFTDSFFDNSLQNADISSLSLSSEGSNINIFTELIDARKKHTKNFLICHLNINSLRYKYDEIKDILLDKVVDCLIISETKLDSSFKDSIFEVDGYKLQRRDRTDHGGGIATFMRADIPARRRFDIECKTLENIVYEVTLDKTKWLIYAIYRPPSMANDIFTNHMHILLDKGSKFIENYMVIGDLNYDILTPDKSQVLDDLCDIFDLANIVKNPTCFMKGYEPSLVDVILTNKNNICFKTLNFNTGVSDCHHMISTFIKGNTPNCVNSKIQYRSFKDFDVNKYISDLDNTVYLHDSSECVDDINTVYNDFETKVSQVIDHHAPIKYRYPRKNSVPYMNRELRKVIYKKQMLRSKFEKYKTSKTWEAYRKQRNLVTKLKRKSINTYFQERCTGGQKSKHFYTTVKPFLSKQSTGSQQKIVLVENDKIVNNTKDICDTFNTFFVNVANDIGKDVIFDGNSHPSILKIKNNTQHNTLFDFKPTDVDTIHKLVSKINIKKATGVEQISSKLLRAGAPVLNKHITTLVNNTIKTSVFPTRLKEAQVVPLHKKNDPLDKKNYRPVSILPTISKVYEMVLSDQLTDLFENIFHTFLCAFRKGHGCQTTLLRLLEDWKTALDENQYVAAILMDLSKAFDCLPHDILLCKLSAYGLSPKSVELLRNYLTGRKQQIKLQGDLSSWADIQKGVPQGSILGPLLLKLLLTTSFILLNMVHCIIMLMITPCLM